MNKETRQALGAYVNLVWATETLMAYLSGQLGTWELSMGQFRMLQMLLGLGPMSQAMLADRLLCGSSNLSVVARNLERRGLVVCRSEHRDARRKTVHLTPEGRALISEVLPLHAKVVGAKMSVLNNREKRILQRVCRKLAQGDVLKFRRAMMRVEDWE
ncbi:MAG: MarR family winged helix-turn-helix transcriptional regulator [Candidatus Acidiferrales bacterium]